MRSGQQRQREDCARRRLHSCDGSQRTPSLYGALSERWIWRTHSPPFPPGIRENQKTEFPRPRFPAMREKNEGDGFFAIRAGSGRFVAGGARRAGNAKQRFAGRIPKRRARERIPQEAVIPESPAKTDRDSDGKTSVAGDFSHARSLLFHRSLRGFFHTFWGGGRGRGGCIAWSRTQARRRRGG